MKQVVNACYSLNENKILHRDLKCANVFISGDGKTVKIGDMNVSKISKKNRLASTQTGKDFGEMELIFLGTPYYASPEV